MVKMPADVKETLAKQKPVPIATASSSGVPNVVFVGLLKIVDDETLMIADNFFNKTAANLAENPQISILCYDSATKKSFQIKGTANACKEGANFDEMRKWVKGVNDKLPAKSCVMVKVDAVYNAMWGPGAGAK
ncbi:MAG TPA: pyridoxamine 5'-phosphate oxidase family protein, partial [Methanotrichaceae archaeon]|nr:pyridoxamine 5'-phosphate oxidase family protein [Methanotrichaceae archaeon]